MGAKYQVSRKGMVAPGEEHLAVDREEIGGKGGFFDVRVSANRGVRYIIWHPVVDWSG